MRWEGLEKLAKIRKFGVKEVTRRLGAEDVGTSLEIGGECARDSKVKVARKNGERGGGRGEVGANISEGGGETSITPVRGEMDVSEGDGSNRGITTGDEDTARPKGVNGDGGKGGEEAFEWRARMSKRVPWSSWRKTMS